MKPCRFSTGGRPDIIWYVTALVTLLAGIDGDGEPLYEDLNSLFRLSQENNMLIMYLSLLNNFSASDWL